MLAICARPALDNTRVLGHAALLAVLVAAIRLQYAPLALALLGIVFLRTGKKLPLALMASMLFLAVGVFDALTWNSGLFHSYLTNLRFNLIIGEMRGGESPAHQFLWWLTLAGGGLGVLCLALALGSWRRYGLLLALSVLLLLTHSLQAHKEYRFIFAIIPLWLLIGADLLVRAGAEVQGAGALVCGIGGRRVRSRIPGRSAEGPAVSATSVSSLVPGEGIHGICPQPGPDLRCLPLSRPRTRRRRGVAG